MNSKTLLNVIVAKTPENSLRKTKALTIEVANSNRTTEKLYKYFGMKMLGKRALVR